MEDPFSRFLCMLQRRCMYSLNRRKYGHYLKRCPSAPLYMPHTARLLCFQRLAVNPIDPLAGQPVDRLQLQYLGLVLMQYLEVTYRHIWPRIDPHPLAG